MRLRTHIFHDDHKFIPETGTILVACASYVLEKIGSQDIITGFLIRSPLFYRALILMIVLSACIICQRGSSCIERAWLKTENCSLSLLSFVVNFYQINLVSNLRASSLFFLPLCHLLGIYTIVPGTWYVRFSGSTSLYVNICL